MGSVARGDAEGQRFRAAAEEYQAARAACLAAFEQLRGGDQRTLQRYVRARERLEAAMRRLARYSYHPDAVADDESGADVAEGDEPGDDEGPGGRGARS